MGTVQQCCEDVSLRLLENGVDCLLVLPIMLQRVFDSV